MDQVVGVGNVLATAVGMPHQIPVGRECEGVRPAGRIGGHDRAPDHGCQYTSLAFGERCRTLGVRPSRGTIGDCYDNALCESFFATLECELLDRYTFRSPAEARAAVFRFIEGWYNPRRRHSALGYQSPAAFEAAYAAAA